MTSSRTDMRSFDYDLPADLIAQEPLQERDASRLLVLPRSDGPPVHRTFRELPDLLEPGDLLVVNDTRVNHARLLGYRRTGAEVEVLLLQDEGERRWRALIRPWRRLDDGERVEVGARRGGTTGGVHIERKLPDGGAVVRLDQNIQDGLSGFGHVPLPPYITREIDDDERYQTVFADASGSAAAPTAGLHFTPDALARLADRGVTVAPVTLHVGLDTFRPVTARYAEDHRIHSEWCRVPPVTLRAITSARTNGGKVVAVGTTVARTLESLAAGWDGNVDAVFECWTDIYITPGYEWTVVDGLITNFHLPKSTLLLMISAFAGRERVLAAYRDAIACRYRFFSFGDAMLILPHGRST